MEAMEIIKAHVNGLQERVCRIKTLTNGGIGFILDEDYAVEIYEEGGEITVNYNGAFDYNGNPQMGCWENAMCGDQAEVINVLNNSHNWE